MIDIDISPYLYSGTIFGLVVSWHGFFTFVAVGTAVTLVGRWAPLRKLDSDTIYSIAIAAIIGGVVGARVVHVIDNWNDIYQHRPVQIFALWSGGIAIWGGILGGFIGGSVYALATKYPVGTIADLTAPALLLVQSIGRLGDIINGEHCAKAADFFLGFRWIHGETAARSCSTGFDGSVHPVIAYEIVWNMISLAIIWKFRGRLKPDGMLFALYLTLYSIGRFGISFLREDRVWALGMQEAHYIALFVLAITIPLLIVKTRFQERVTIESLTPDDGNTVAGPGFMHKTRAERRRRTKR